VLRLGGLDFFPILQEGEPMYDRYADLKMILAAMAVLVALPCSVMAQGDDSDTLAKLTAALELTDEQVPQVGAVLEKFATDMDAAAAMAEVEEPDNQAVLGAVKKARSDFKTGMKGALNKEQFQTLETTIDSIFQEMFEDIAEIRIMDLEPLLDLTPEQAEALKPIMGTALRKMIGVFFEYGDTKLNKPTKIKMGKKLKGIQSDLNKGLAEVLSEEQLAKYEAHKEAAKS
jgi:hypothetical protein